MPSFFLGSCRGGVPPVSSAFPTEAVFSSLTTHKPHLPTFPKRGTYRPKIAVREDEISLSHSFLADSPLRRLRPFSKITRTSKEAQKIVQKDRSKRVKDARSEAQREIEDYRKQKEEEFKKFEKEHSSGNKKAEEDARQDADDQMQSIKGSGDKAGAQVVEDLLRVVTDVRPEVPDRVEAPP
ncbi:MAG: hypothetical protein LQ348_006040 [Seirophora lacunosa]|nr:MAG: hypothetical protein LQ348_006040 [Seirophora lacunosa]